MKKLILILIILMAACSLFSRVTEREVTQDEMLTIHKNTRFTEALNAMETLSQQYEGKKIINMSTFNNPIDIPLNQVYWKEALYILIKHHNLTMEELPGSYIIRDPVLTEKEKKIAKAKITPADKEIRISSILFMQDKSLSHEVGIDWSTLFSGKVNAEIKFLGNRVTDQIIQASGTKTEDFELKDGGNVTLDVETLLSIVESNQKGTILARPSVNVLSGKRGFIQVGEAFSVRLRDEEGNISEKFYETGIILEVTPTIIIDPETGEEYVHLRSKVEKSSAIPGALTTIINKTSTTTEVTLFNGEETVIGGIYDTDTRYERVGIPFLKDLPWWVFGLKYIFGYNRKEISETEMIIIIKAEIVEPLNARAQKVQPITEGIKQLRDDNTRTEKLFQKGEWHLDVKDE